MTPIDIRTLDLGDQFRLVWSFFWRGLLIAVGSALTGGVLGFVAGAVIGVAAAIAGTPQESIRGMGQLVGGFMGLVSALVFTYLYARWLLVGRLGRFRLVLTLADNPRVVPGAVQG